MTPHIDTSDRNELKSLVRGTIHLPGGDGYDQARQVWNGMIDRRPAAIVCAAGVADVMATIRFAGKRELPVALRCGGHNVAGNAVGDGGIVIDLARLKSARVDPTKRRVCAGGGVLWNEYDHETQAFGLASPGGAISTTGIAGLTLGGGYGYLSRRYGMACDNLLSADVVTASGELVTASADSHPDLFWALRRRRELWGGDVVRISTSSRPGSSERDDCVSVRNVQAGPAAVSRPVYGSERRLDDDGRNPAGSQWRVYCRRVVESYRNGRGGPTRHSADSRAGIGSDGHGRANAVLRDAAATGCDLPEGNASLLEIRIREQCHG